MEKRKQPLFENYVQVPHGIKFIWPIISAVVPTPLVLISSSANLLIPYVRKQKPQIIKQKFH